MSRLNRLKLVIKTSGFLGLFTFLIARILGQSDLIRPASTVDIRRAGIAFSHDVRSFVKSLVGEFESHLSDELILEARQINAEIEARTKDAHHFFPENWNSEEQLRIALYLLVRIFKPELVVETGTANGSSAAAICAGLSANRSGILVSVDVKDSSAILVSESHRDFLLLRKTGGSDKELREICSSASAKYSGFKIFLHDSDHSYFGQYSDYKTAEDLGFNLVLSDDVDASLAFTDFAGKAGVALFDTRKIIGGVIVKN